jgi:hypothetical protein
MSAILYSRGLGPLELIQGSVGPQPAQIRAWEPKNEPGTAFCANPCTDKRQGYLLPCVTFYPGGFNLPRSIATSQ